MHVVGMSGGGGVCVLIKIPRMTIRNSCLPGDYYLIAFRNSHCSCMYEYDIIVLFQSKK